MKTKWLWPVFLGFFAIAMIGVLAGSSGSHWGTIAARVGVIGGVATAFALFFAKVTSRSE